MAFLHADDPRHPDYDRHLGFRPCRMERCREECHPWHEEAIVETPQERMLAICEAQAEQLAAQLRLELAAHERTLAESMNLRATRVLQTESGEVIATEWQCPSCRGRGWLSSPCVGCETCHGAGVVVARERAFISVMVEATRPRESNEIAARRAAARLGWERRRNGK